MDTSRVSTAYTKAADQIMAEVRAELADITAAAHAISQQAKKKEDDSVLAALRAKLFNTRP